MRVKPLKTLNIPAEAASEASPQRSKSSKRDSAPMRINHANLPTRQHTANTDPAQGHRPRNTGGRMLAKERAKADAVIASTSSLWYAGAAFDRSPEAHTLPKPTRLLSTQQAAVLDKTPSLLALSPSASSQASENGNVLGLATSCPAASKHLGPGTKTTRSSQLSRQASSETDRVVLTEPVDLKTKSRDLLSMLRNGNQKVPQTNVQGPQTHHDRLPRSLVSLTTAHSGASSSDDLEEMTRQVRKLLNITQ